MGVARGVVLLGTEVGTVVATVVVVIPGALDGLEEDEYVGTADTDGASSSSSGFKSSEISTLAEDIVFEGGCMRIICASPDGALFCCALQWDQDWCSTQRTTENTSAHQ